jgi:hypothetical protein
MSIVEYGDYDNEVRICQNDVLMKLITSRKMCLLGLFIPIESLGPTISAVGIAKSKATHPLPAKSRCLSACSSGCTKNTIPGVAQMSTSHKSQNHPLDISSLF